MGESSNEGLELCKVLVHTLPPGNYDVYLGPILFCQSLQFIFQVADIVPLYSFINTIKSVQWGSGEYFRIKLVKSLLF